jgi:hypothetical protein
MEAMVLPQDSGLRDDTASHVCCAQNHWREVTAFTKSTDHAVSTSPSTTLVPHIIYAFPLCHLPYF